MSISSSYRKLIRTFSHSMKIDIVDVGKNNIWAKINDEIEYQ